MNESNPPIPDFPALFNKRPATVGFAENEVRVLTGDTTILHPLPKAALEITFRMRIEAISEAARLNSTTFPEGTGELACKILPAHQGRMT